MFKSGYTHSCSICVCHVVSSLSGCGQTQTGLSRGFPENFPVSQEISVEIANSPIRRFRVQGQAGQAYSKSFLELGETVLLMWMTGAGRVLVGWFLFLFVFNSRFLPCTREQKERARVSTFQFGSLLWSQDNASPGRKPPKNVMAPL